METSVQIKGQIESDGIHFSKSMLRAIERKIERWVEVHSSDRTHEASYTLRILKEGHGHFFTCRLEIVQGEKSWLGWDCGNDIHQALSRCLERLGDSRATASKQLPTLIPFKIFAAGGMRHS